MPSMRMKQKSISPIHRVNNQCNRNIIATPYKNIEHT